MSTSPTPPLQLSDLRLSATAEANDQRSDKSTRRRRLHPIAISLLLPATAILLLELLSRIGYLPANLMPAPSEVLNTIFWLGQHGLAQHVVASTIRVGIGFFLGTLLAIPVGCLVGLSSRASQLIDPSIQGMRAIPSLAWGPLLLLWLGIDETPKIALITIGAFFPIYMGVVSGLRGVDRKMIEVAELYGLSKTAQIQRVYLPAASPAILTGLRNGLSLAWMFMVAAELIAASHGLGYLLSDGRESSRADIVLAAILILAVLGKISDSLVRLVEQRLLKWRDSYIES